jgi:hypothetical protein
MSDEPRAESALNAAEEAWLELLAQAEATARGGASRGQNPMLGVRPRMSQKVESCH